MRVSRQPPCTEEEFQALMRAVEDQLQQDGTPIPIRPIQGLALISKWLGVAQDISVPDRDPIPDCYRGRDLTIRAYRWFDERYGDKLKMDFSPGRTVVLIRNDVWVVDLPLMYGSQTVIASPGRPSEPMPPGGWTEKPPPFNVVDTVQDLTPALRRSLTNVELQEILEKFVLAHETFRQFRPAAGPLVVEALTDYSTTVHHLAKSRPHAGQAKWSALQAAEKVLKSAIDARGRTPPRIHDLQKLAQQAEDVGAPTVDSHVLQAIRCDAGVRYGQPQVTIHEAVEAHHASLVVGYVVSGGADTLPSWKSGTR